ncbi:MAG TPA: hypothetical protein VLM85_27100 [Polyangiaceae bacterium]|nr:hypothetical protein [Polyangiaceae bacterium]
MSRWAMRPETALFVLLFGAYAYFFPAGGWNQNSRFDLTRALVERHTVVIDAYRDNTFDLAVRDGHAYCDKAPGVSLMAVVPYAMVFAARGARPPEGRALDDAAYLATVVAVAVPSALGGVMLFSLLGALGVSVTQRAFAAAAYGLGTLAFPYSTMLYGHQVAASLLVAAFALLAHERRGARARPLLVGALLGWSVVVEYPAAIGAVTLATYAASLDRPWRRLAWIALGASLPALVLAAYHRVAFGGPATLPYAFSNQQPRHSGAFMGIGAPSLHAIGHLLFTDYRGLFFATPALLLALPGSWQLARDLATRTEAIVCAVIFLVFVWMNGSLVDWQGGSTVGARYLVPAIPFVAACAAAVRPRSELTRLGRAAGAALAPVSCASMLVATSVDPQPSVRVMHPWREYLLPAFFQGHLGLNAQGMDSALGPAGGAPRAWNLGLRMGLAGRWTLAPLVVFVIVACAWLAIATRRAAVAPAAPSSR